MNAMPSLVGGPSGSRGDIRGQEDNGRDDDDVDLEDPMAAYIRQERVRGPYSCPNVTYDPPPPPTLKRFADRGLPYSSSGYSYENLKKDPALLPLPSRKRTSTRRTSLTRKKRNGTSRTKRKSDIAIGIRTNGMANASVREEGRALDRGPGLHRRQGGEMMGGDQLGMDGMKPKAEIGKRECDLGATMSLDLLLEAVDGMTGRRRGTQELTDRDRGRGSVRRTGRAEREATVTMDREGIDGGIDRFEMTDSRGLARMRWCELWN